MPHGKSQDSSEITRLMPCLTIKATINTGKLNFLTMWKIGSTIQVAAEIRTYNMAIIDINKIH